MKLKKIIAKFVCFGYEPETRLQNLSSFLSISAACLVLFLAFPVVSVILPPVTMAKFQKATEGMEGFLYLPTEPPQFVSLPKAKKREAKVEQKIKLTDKDLLSQDIVIPPPENPGMKKIRACWHQNIPRDMDPNNLVKPGFEMSALNLIGLKAEIKIEYIEKKEFSELFTGLEKGECDLVMGGVSRTDERDAKFRSSHNLGRGGVGIASRSKFEEFEPQIKFKYFKKVFFSVFFFGVCLLTFLTLVLIGCYLWLVDPNKTTTDFKKAKGIEKGILWAIQYFTTAGGDPDPLRKRKIIAKVAATVLGWFFSSIVISLTMMCFQFQMTKDDGVLLSDLHNKRVAVRKDTTHHKVLSEYKTGELTFVSNIEEALNLLTEDKFDAVIHDLDSLRYFANEQFDGLITVADQGFDDSMVFYFPQDSRVADVIDYYISQIQNYTRNPKNNEWKLLKEQYYGKSNR